MIAYYKNIRSAKRQYLRLELSGKRDFLSLTFQYFELLKETKTEKALELEVEHWGCPTLSHSLTKLLDNLYTALVASHIAISLLSCFLIKLQQYDHIVGSLTYNHSSGR